MEAPLVCIETIKMEKEYSLKSDKNHLFKIYFKNFSSYIEIDSFFQDEFLKHEYTKKFYLEELKQNKYLSICDSIDEIFEQIVFNIDKNNLNLKEDIKQIIINIPVEHLKVKEITFILPLKIKKDNEKLEDLIIEINNLKKGLKDIKENLNEKIELLTKENIELKKKDELHDK